jgi:hypothetical protein
VIAGEAVVAAWTQSRADLTGKDNPLPVGAFLNQNRPRSPADGAYAVINRAPGGATLAIAEDSPFTTVRVLASIYAGTQQAAENAAQAWLDAVRTLTGDPVPVPGSDGAVIRVTDNYTGPAFQPPGATEYEPYCFTAGADFILQDQGS